MPRLRRYLVCGAFIACCLLPQSPAIAGQAPDDPLSSDLNGAELPPETQRNLAERFAPVLVFHPSEKYFPANPLFQLAGRTAADGQQGGYEGASSALGTSGDRRERYEALTRDQKAALATVFYRAYRARVDSEAVIVIEYWLYYVHNTYRIRGNIFPLWVDGSHPNDLEHIHVVARQTSDSQLVLQEVYASAHAGTMPANRHRFTEAPAVEHVRFLVELGSHATAPDVDGDGVFTPGADGTSGYKKLWGIRDRGITWARYNPAYMDPRSGGNSIVFEPAANPPEPNQLSYRLLPAYEVSSAFAALDLTNQERQSLFETDRFWFRRLFGANNGSSGKLLVPPERSTKPSSIGFNQFASGERGILVGAQMNMEEQGLVVGARYSYLFGGQYLPDLMVQADGIAANRPGKNGVGPVRYLSTLFLATYPIDGATTVMFGRGLVTNSLTFDRRQWDWVGAVEFPVGHMRVYFATRSWGPLTNFTKEVRLSYFF